ncbi:MAG: DUF507 family protein [Deltaproteobacteria bacterium]|nr:DUF507 family protein [Deltaproteobacteria bacterium]
MSRLSESRISHIAHLIVDGLWKEDLADFPNEARALAETKSIVAEFFNVEDRVDEVVRQKIQSLSRPVPPGSREWDILYRPARAAREPGVGYPLPEVPRGGA